MKLFQNKRSTCSRPPPATRGTFVLWNLAVDITAYATDPLDLKTQHVIVYHPSHDDGIKWKHLPRYWPFVRGIQQFPVNYPKRPWRRALMFSLICARINGWANNNEADDLIRHRAYYDVIVMPWNAMLIHYILGPFVIYDIHSHRI